MRTASVLAWISGLGFGLPGIYGIWHLNNRGSIATFMGFPTYGNGVFENFGVKTSVPLLAAFVVVCSAECVAGWLLWGSQQAGAILSLVLLPIGLVFWIGFSLPIPPILGLARTVLVLANWSSLSS